MLESRKIFDIEDYFEGSKWSCQICGALVTTSNMDKHYLYHKGKDDHVNDNDHFKNT